MATIKVTDIVQRVENVLQDTNVRWPRLELQNWINESYLTITLLRPDANAESGTFTCAAGTRQVLTTDFPSALRLLDVTRNVAEKSSKKVVRLVARSALDDQRPTWHTEDETLNIQLFTFDPRQPKQFFVYPPASDEAEIEVVYSNAPNAHTLTEVELAPIGGSDEVIYLDDDYTTPIIDWVLYRAYSKDAESGANEQRASASYSAFNSTIGAKSKTDSAAAPGNGVA